MKKALLIAGGIYVVYVVFENRSRLDTVLDQQDDLLDILEDHQAILGVRRG